MATVIEENEVSINDVFYPTSRPVQAILASLYPPKITMGDTSRDSQTRASVISWADWRGGLGDLVGDQPRELCQFSDQAHKSWQRPCRYRLCVQS